MGFEVADEAARLEELKAIDSDIEGMSQYDKYEMGLSIEDGSDSDSDGLTDKEEIEIYDSDPLKASTAVDFVDLEHQQIQQLLVILIFLVLVLDVLLEHKIKS